MTHVEQGKYRGKHSEDKKLDERIADEINKVKKEERLACVAASRIADNLGVSMEAVGVAADLLEIKIEQCQLGLFGYGRTKGKHSIVELPESVPAELEKSIREALADERLPCLVAWNIAGEHGVTKRAVCAAADKLGIKSSKCQLGVFPTFK
jgi:hypothetical protein